MNTGGVLWARGFQT